MNKKTNISVFIMSLLVFIITTYTCSDASSNYARSILSDSITLLSKTGDIASIAIPVDVKPSNEFEFQHMDQKRVNEILDYVISSLKVVIDIDRNIKEAHYYLGVAYTRKMER
ncbi:MAG: hypothetical protein AAGU32_12975 [Bacillota bacterium]